MSSSQTTSEAMNTSDSANASHMTDSSSTDASVSSSTSTPLSKHASKKHSRQSRRALAGQSKRDEAAAIRKEEKELDALEALEYCRKCVKVDCPPLPMQPMNEATNAAVSTFATAASAVSFSSVSPSPPHPQRYSLLVQYSGTSYKGMQLQNRQNHIPTIEKDLLHAMWRCGAICDGGGEGDGSDGNNNLATLPSLQWQRCARTDIGVHAAFNIVSCLMIYDADLVRRMNSVLTKQIRVIDILPLCPVPTDETTLAKLEDGDAREFHCKHSCTGRMYEYLMPTAVFGFEMEKKEEQKVNENVEMDTFSSTTIATTSASVTLAPPPSSLPTPESTIDFDTIPTRILHRLLSSANTALTTLRSKKDSPGFLLSSEQSSSSSSAAISLARYHSAQSLNNDLPLIYTHLRNIRRKLHSLTKGLGEFRYDEKKEETELLELRTRLSEEMAKEERRIEEGKNAMQTEDQSSTAAASSSMPSSMPPSTSSASQVSSTTHLTPPAHILSIFLTSLSSANIVVPSVASSSTGESTSTGLELTSYQSSRLTPAQVAHLNTLLSFFTGQHDFRNFTKRLEKVIVSLKGRPGKKMKLEEEEKWMREKEQTNQGSAASSSVASIAASPSPVAAAPLESSPSSSPTPAASSPSTTEPRPTDASYTLRRIYSCRVLELIQRDGVEYARISIEGQSFMLNQIRKMMALVVMCVRGMVGKVENNGSSTNSTELDYTAVFQRYLNTDGAEYEIQLAPARGLLLCGATFNRYERMCTTSPQPHLYSITQAMERHRQAIDDFKRDILESEICSLFSSHATYRQWLLTLEPPRLLVRSEETEA